MKNKNIVQETIDEYKITIPEKLTIEDLRQELIKLIYSSHELKMNFIDRLNNGEITKDDLTEKLNKFINIITTTKNIINLKYEFKNNFILKLKNGEINKDDLIKDLNDFKNNNRIN